MAEFDTDFSYSTPAAELDCKSLSALLARQFRPQAPDMACGLARSKLR